MRLCCCHCCPCRPLACHDWQPFRLASGKRSSGETRPSALSSASVAHCCHCPRSACRPASTFWIMVRACAGVIGNEAAGKLAPWSSRCIGCQPCHVQGSPIPWPCMDELILDSNLAYLAMHCLFHTSFLGRRRRLAIASFQVSLVARQDQRKERPSCKS